MSKRSSILSDMDVCNMIKKQNFSVLESNTKTREEDKKKIVLSGSLKSEIKGSQKQRVWKEQIFCNQIICDSKKSSKDSCSWHDPHQIHNECLTPCIHLASLCSLFTVFTPLQ